MAEVAGIQVGMKMTELKQIQQRDMRNAILMLAVLSMVGSAALYFIDATFLRYPLIWGAIPYDLLSPNPE